MIAMALFVGLAAIALPSVLGEIDRRAYESAEQLITSQLLLARAHAQVTGRSVEVSYYTEGSTVVARFFDPAQDPGGGDDAFTSADELGVSRDGQSDPQAIHERWAYRALADGVTISREPPPDPDEPFSAESFASEDSLDTLASEPETIRIVVFLSDGSTLLSVPVWLVGDERRAGVFSVNAWTGLPVFDLRVSGELGEPEDGEEDEEEEDPFEAAEEPDERPRDDREPTGSRTDPGADESGQDATEGDEEDDR